MLAQDTFIRKTEWLSRQVYWRCRSLRTFRQKQQSQKKETPQAIPRAELRDFLKEIGLNHEPRPVMVHSSVHSFRFTNEDAPQQALSMIATANQLLQDMISLIGETGTLAMPTHPHYPEALETIDAIDMDDLVLTYDPKKTPCNVGLLNELFRISKLSQRSLYPINTISCCGPLTETILRDNLSGEKPLPHGTNSAYHQIYKHDGLVIGVGIPLVPYLTITHVAEDLLAEERPLDPFYRERCFDIVTPTEVKRQTIRERHPHLRRCYLAKTLAHDLRKEGLLHENHIGKVRVDWIKAKELVDYILERNKKGGLYPFWLPRLAGPFR